jgi:hypothetical protein
MFDDFLYHPHLFPLPSRERVRERGKNANNILYEKKILIIRSNK